MFRKLVKAIRRTLDDAGIEYTSTVRYHETPASADFHVLAPVEYVISITPTKAAVLTDELDDGQP